MDILILCGGNGTRLFPLSRTELPKQFLPLTEKDNTRKRTRPSFAYLAI